MSNLYVKIIKFTKVFLHRHTHAHPRIFQEKQSFLGCTNIKTSRTAGEPTSNGHFKFYYKLGWSFPALFCVPLVLVQYLYLTMTNLVLER